MGIIISQPLAFEETHDRQLRGELEIAAARREEKNKSKVSLLN